MKIKNVTFQNFKNKSGIQELTGLDLFTGKNGSGKSSVLQAIQLAINGAIEDASTPKKIFAYSSNPAIMNIGIESDDGNKINRMFERKITTKRTTGEQTVKYASNITCNFSQSKKQKEIEEDIAETFGNLPMAFDFSYFNTLSENAQKEFILQFSDNSFSEEKAKKYLEEKAAGNQNYLTVVDNLFTKFAKVQNMEEKVKSMLTEAKDDLSYFKQEVEKIRLSIQKLQEEKMKNGVDVKGLIIEQKELDKLREKQIQIEKKLSVLENDEKRKNNLVAQLNNLTAALENNKIQDNNKIKAVIEEKRQKLQTLNANSKQLAAEIKTLSDRIQKGTNVITSIQQNLEKVKDQGTTLRAEYNSFSKLFKSVQSMKGCCCLSKSVPCNTDFSKWLSSAKEKLAADKKKLDTLLIQYKNEASKCDKDKAMLDSLICKREKNIATQQSIVRNINLLNSDIATLTKQIEQTANNENATNEKIKLIKKEISTLNNGYEENSKTNKEELEKIKNRIKELKNIINEKQKIKGVVENIKLQEKQFDETTINVEVYKKLVQDLGPKGLLNELFKASVAPLVSQINKYLKMFGIKKNFFIQTEDGSEQQVLNFGVGGVQFQALSTGQQALVSLAMIVAFIQNSKCPLKILCIDKGDTLDEENFNNMIKGLSEMHKQGLLDNILVTTCKEVKNTEDFKVFSF